MAIFNAPQLYQLLAIPLMPTTSTPDDDVLWSGKATLFLSKEKISTVNLFFSIFLKLYNFFFLEST